MNRTLHIISLTFAVLTIFATATTADPTPPPIPDAPARWVVECADTPLASHPAAMGLTWPAPARRIVIYVCDRPGASRQVLLHELGHAWAAERLTSREEWLWMRRRGTDAWNPTDPYDWPAWDRPWSERPAEEFADAYRWCNGGTWGRVRQSLPAPTEADCAWMRWALAD